MASKQMVLIIASVVMMMASSVHCGNHNRHNNQQSAPKQSIVDILVADPNYSTLVTAVKTVGLVETLSTGKL